MISRRQFILGSGMSLMLDAIPTFQHRSGLPAIDDLPGSTKKLSGGAFGTTWQLTIPLDSPIDDIIEICNNTIQKINQALSPWHTHSDIYKFNTTYSSDWLPVTTCCTNVIRKALQIASKSHGYFDPTVGPLVGRAGFGPIVQSYDIPDYKQIDVRTNYLRKNHPSLTLDPCGIAKGYALDLMVNDLIKLGVTDHFLEIGGEIRANGTHPSGREWWAGIESPTANTKTLLRKIKLSNMALATSSIKHNSYHTKNNIVSHIIDPLSEGPVESSLVSVSVVAPTAMLADGWATAMMAANEHNAVKMAEALNLPSLIIVNNDNNALKEISIAGFDDLQQ